MQPNLSRTALQLIHNGDIHSPYHAEHIQESDVIVLDKSRRSLGLWAACLILARLDIRRYTQRYNMYRDKEVYWIAFETIREPSNLQGIFLEPLVESSRRTWMVYRIRPMRLNWK